jgi:hypothetical protein
LKCQGQVPAAPTAEGAKPSTQRPKAAAPAVGPQVTTPAWAAKGYADWAGAAAAFDKPRDLVPLADGTLCVADTGNHVLRKVTPEGKVSTYAGSRDGERGFAESGLPTARLD